MKHKVNKKVLRRILSLILVMTMLVTGLGLDMMEEFVFATQKAKKVEDNQRDEVKVVKELVNERTESSNTYLMSDGSKKLEILGENIRYEENGKLKDYDTSLSKISKEDKNELENTVAENNLDEFDYVNESGDAKQYFPAEYKDGSEIVMSKDKYSLSFSLCTDNEDIFKAKLNNDEIRYAATDENVEYQYISLRNGVKENIVLSNRPETNVFKYLLKGKNIDYKLLRSGEISIQDKKTKIQIGRIEPPNIIDGEGNVDYTKVKYEFHNNGENTFLKIVVDNEYLDDENTKYPITVDPTAVWFNTKLPTTIVNSVTGRSDDVVLANTLLVENNYVYNEKQDTRSSRVYIDTSNLIGGTDWLVGTPEISGKYIENSYLYLGEKVASKENVQVDVKSVESAWDVNTITWNTQPEISNKIIATTWNKGVDGRNHGVNITKWVQAIADGKKENYGLVLEAAEEGTQCSYYGTIQPGSNFMCIDVIYRDFEKYDASIEVTIEYDSEIGKFQASIEDTNALDEGVTVKGYKVFARKNDGNKFVSVYQGTDITEDAEIGIESDCSKIDYRVCILYSDGTVKPSNIVSFKQNTDITQDEVGNDITTVLYEQTTFDTDGDGLEDGYEIWDFKTLWNTETSESTEENPVYNLDTDKDGFPDSYEVFTLGTDPAVANETGTDSDGDGWTDLKEYQEGTDPWLKDSDFDGINDRGDAIPRKTNDYTRQTRAAEAMVHKGLYDKQFSETIEEVINIYIINIYRGDIKQITANYGDSSLNKTLKYFYDEKGNNTAIIEVYDENYDPNHTQTICITYTYDENDKVTFICDQRTKYTMGYTSNGDIANLKVGNQTLIDYDDTKIVNNSGEDGSIENISVGEIITQNEHTDTYGNNQVVRTVTTNYKVAENDTTSKATKIEVFYNTNQIATYVTELNSEGNILKLEDYSAKEDVPVVWNYSYTDRGQTFTRSDNFIKAIQTSENEQGVNTKQTSFGFKDIKNQNKTYTDIVSTLTETETTEDGSEYERNIRTKILHNADVSSITNLDEQTEEKIRSNKYNADVVKSTLNEVSNTNTTFDVNVYGTVADKNFNYIYDLAGNITEIKDGNDIKYQYSYDAHGRLTDEKDYITLKEVAYDYNTDGNIYGKTVYSINSSGNRTDNNGSTIHYNYNNSNWSDQLTSYNGYAITYDNVGNPLTYIGGLSFAWSRGRQLSEVTLTNNSTASYEYNQYGLRTKKVTKEATTKYEWDKDKLLRETITYNQTNGIVDIWYLYNVDEKIIGFEYSYLNLTNDIVKARVYYEKNLQGDVIGLLDARGAEIASYTYDAWGNITSHTYVEGNEIPYNLNHILYRGYYRDEETGFYYLQSRYYDAEIGRFINADGAMMIGTEGNDIYKDNLYIYCNSNPINRVDYTGEKSNRKKIKFKYNRSDARKYMERYWKVKAKENGWWIFSSTSYSGYNKRFPYLERGDCTNFASQCLWQGGIPMTWCWYCYNTEWGYEFTHSWSVVLEQRDYIKKTIVAKTTRINCNVSVESIKKYIKNNKPQVGDIIYFHAKGKKSLHIQQ